ncbi:hypothetical protein [Paenibacillus sp. NPDC058177]|uniref:hypothetical protein n=1 Tax=Paenibacillus sp. NPDC058177 TaxID=3346369 RepID=UPI0036DBCFCA
MDELNWEVIKGGFSGFEELAVEYVQNEHTSHTGWKPTAKTRDGNKDAFTVNGSYPTIIMGYLPVEGAQEEWWMEAKYSLKSQNLTRYKLDATIVSAILKGNVTKIIFVTNIDVHSKTIIDIRNALEDSINCNDVTFCTKSTLEYWLFKNPKVLEKYFGRTQSKLLVRKNIFVIENIDFYVDPCKHLSFKEPMRALYTGKSYVASFAVFSSSDCNVKLSLDSSIRSMLSCNTRKISLKKGENYVLVSVKVKEGIKYEKSLNGIVFKINNEINCMTKVGVIIIPSNGLPLNLHSQRAIIDQISDRFEFFSKRPALEIHSILGESGVGKTYVLDEIARTLPLKRTATLFLSFSKDPVSNHTLLVDFVLFLLFPFISAGEIDADYLSKLKKTFYVSGYLIDMVTNKNNPDMLIKLIETYNSSLEHKLFPLFSSANPKVVIIDDLHKLSNIGMQFFSSLISELRECNSHVFFILSSNGTQSHSEEKLLLPAISEYHCQLTIKDLIKSANKNTLITDNVDENIIRILFPNAINFFFFLEFIRNFETISTIGELIFLFKSFQSNEQSEEYILGALQRSFNQNSDSHKWCNQIFRSLNGIDGGIEPNDSIKLLLVERLVKYNTEGRIVPYNDMYVEIYKKYYGGIRSSLQMHYSNKYEEMQHKIYFNNDTKELETTVNQILDLKNSEQYYAIIYILEQVFENTDHQLKDLLQDSMYYKLYFVYAYAVANSSKKISGSSVFEKIYEETKNHSDFEVTRICTDAISELINSRYESLRFLETEYLIIDLNKKLLTLCNFNYITSPMEELDSYILGRIINLLILSEKKEATAEKEFELLDSMLSISPKNYDSMVSVVFRYARTLYARDALYADELLNRCLKMLAKLPGKHEKIASLISFENTFLKIIRSGNIFLMPELLQYHEKLKRNFFNDYRKGIFGLIAILYVHGEIDKGNHYLFSDVMVARKFRPRQEGFYYQTLALYEMIAVNNKFNAIELLKKSQNIFKELTEYESIIIHNIDVVNQGRFSPERIEFYLGSEMSKDMYYLDPRCCW